jgi:hypothetical protein
MHITSRVALTIAIGVGAAAPASAQRLPFERSMDVTGVAKLDVSTIRGKIEVTAGDTGRVTITGAVTVRVGFDVPANALEIAHRIADHPPVEREGNTIRLRPPGDATDRRAVTVNYLVRVPPNTEVVTQSDSGATSVSGVKGPINVRTQSAAIDLGRLGGAATVTTGSGAVTVDGVAGPLTVTTSSSAFTGRGLAGSLRVDTGNGAVDATLTGDGDVEVKTGSSAIRLTGVRGALTTSTQSGRVIVQGAPTRPWTATTGSSSVEFSVTGAGFNVDASSRSGSIKVEGSPVQGSVSKDKVIGTVRGGGPILRVTTGSGAIRIKVG